MFEKVTLDNFKSFDHIEFDLRGKGNKPLPHAIIYGENGSGKSNLVSAFVFLKETIDTLSIDSFFEGVRDKISERAPLPKEATDEITESWELDYSQQMMLKSLLSGENCCKLNDWVRSCRMINGGSVRVSYAFRVGGGLGSYLMEFDNNNDLVREELGWTLGKDVLSFSASRVKNQSAFSYGGIFSDDKYSKEVEELLNRYWGKNTFLSIMGHQFENNNYEFMEQRTEKSFIEIMKFFDTFVVSRNGKHWDVKYPETINIVKGAIRSDEKKQLLAMQDALSAFFTRTYSDIKKVYYRIEENANGIRYELIFTKKICGVLRDIEASLESSGTLKLLENFQAFIGCCRGNTVIIDELDTGVHDILMDNVLLDLISSNKGQLIVTTHNTMLLEHVLPKHIFIIQIDSEGYKRIVPISELERTQKNHNNRNRYISGLFGGLPMSEEIDFTDISDMAPNWR